MNSAVKSGLEGVVAAETRLSHVDGEAGVLILAGLPVEVLAPNAAFEETIHLFLRGALPTAAELERLRGELRPARTLAPATEELLDLAAQERLEVMEALRLGADSLCLGRRETTPEADALRLIAGMPVLVARYWRRLQGQKPIAPAPELGHAANYLYMIDGEAPSPARVRGLETYLNTVVDHGMNASTFTARVITSTGSDLYSAVVGGIGALKGPLHGGAPGPALDMVFEIGEASRAEDYLRKKIASGDRLMGFGHRVYKVRDPRAEVLEAAAERLAAGGENRELHQLARQVEEVALRVLEEEKPGRRLKTNVEYYTALLLHGLGLPAELFTPTFAVARVVGWLAHCFEQRSTGRLIRPASEYTGPHSQWTPLGAR